MKKNRVGWILMGLFSAALGLVASAGCTSTRGECLKACNRVCDVSETCEEYIPGDFDVNGCLDDCPEFCDDTLDAKEKECDRGITIDSAAVNDCHESLGEMESACLRSDGASVLQNYGEVSSNCTAAKYYRCN